MKAKNHANERYRETHDIKQLVEKFESCTLPTADFDHGAHLTVALWHLAGLPEPEAISRVRAGLHRYTKHNNVEAIYNETITLFWLKIVHRFIDQTDASIPLAERANLLINTYDNSKLPFEYFSRELVESPEAKGGWVEPDLKPLDF